MHIPRLYIPQPLAEDTLITLEPAAAHHIAKVLRMKVRRELRLFNGEVFSSTNFSTAPVLGEFSAVLHAIEKKSVQVSVGSFIPRETESSLSTDLGVCLIKNDRMDWLLQKATELGVTSITPLWSEYTDVKIPAERLEKKIQHWQQVLISACEQSERVAIPVLHAPVKLPQWLASTTAEQKYVLHPYLDNRSPFSKASYHQPQRVALLVGPEGGLSDAEAELALQHQFVGMVLGRRILRAETAPLVALSLLQSYYGDFNL